MEEGIRAFVVKAHQPLAGLLPPAKVSKTCDATLCAEPGLTARSFGLHNACMCSCIHACMSGVREHERTRATADEAQKSRDRYKKTLAMCAGADECTIECSSKPASSHHPIFQSKPHTNVNQCHLPMADPISFCRWHAGSNFGLPNWVAAPCAQFARRSSATCDAPWQTSPRWRLAHN